jgi:hypothetical protein
LPRGSLDDESDRACDAGPSSVRGGTLRQRRSHRPRRQAGCPFDALHVGTLVCRLGVEHLVDRRELVEDLGHAPWEAKRAAGRDGRGAGVIDEPLPTRPRQSGV